LSSTPTELESTISEFGNDTTGSDLQGHDAEPEDYWRSVAPQAGCLIRFSGHSVIVDIGEGLHASYGSADEENRLEELLIDNNKNPIVVIRQIRMPTGLLMDGSFHDEERQNRL